MSEPTDKPASDPTPDHRYCRHLKMDGVRCGRKIPLGHVHCYHHRHNRNPSFVRHHGKIRIPLLEDISSLQVTTTAALHALVNGSLDRRDARTILYGVSVSAGLLRFDLAEKRWLHQTGQTRPEPIADFAVMGHEHVAIEDPLPVAADVPVSVPCSSLDPEDDFLSPKTFIGFDEKMRVPPAAPGTHDELGRDWPCPYRFNYCQGPGPKASCHYCSGSMRWEDVHPGEPDPGAPGPLPTVDLNWTFLPPRDIAAPQTGALPLSPGVVQGDRVRDSALSARALPASLCKIENAVILSESSELAAPAVGRNHPFSRESNGPAFPRATSPLSLPAPEILPPARESAHADRDPEVWVSTLTPLDPIPDPNLLPVLVASAEEQAVAPGSHRGRHYLCPPTDSTTSFSDAPIFRHPFLSAVSPQAQGNTCGNSPIWGWLGETLFPILLNELEAASPASRNPLRPYDPANGS